MKNETAEQQAKTLRSINNNMVLFFGWAELVGGVIAAAISVAAIALAVIAVKL